MQGSPRPATRAASLAMLLPAWLLLACNPTMLDNEIGDGGEGGDEDLSAGLDGPKGDGGAGCVNLQCRVVNCKAQGKPSTTLSGVVNIPAGNLPLYNATVYVPNRPLREIVDGPACDICGAAPDGDPVALARTDVTGAFTIENVPAGAQVPLVISLGKWRRQITIPAVEACSDNPLPAEQTRLPRNRAEGHLPKIALTTGGFDAVECLLRKLGIDDAEFTLEEARGGGGRVNLFSGHGGAVSYQAPLNGGAPFTAASDIPLTTSGWWSRYDNLKRYDLLLLSCEGGQNLPEKSMAARRALQQFIDSGGRAFASHWHNGWIAGGPPPLSTVATFYDFADGLEFKTISATIDESSDRGKALSQWLFNVRASMPKGTLPILHARSTVKTLSSTLTQRFVYYDDPMRGMEDAQYFTFNAPVGAAPGAQCGRMVFTDMHVSGNDASTPDPALDLSSPTTPFPSGCITRELSPQEKALIFLLFDLAGCVTPVLG